MAPALGATGGSRAGAGSRPRGRASGKRGSNSNVPIRVLISIVSVLVRTLRRCWRGLDRAALSLLLQKNSSDADERSGPGVIALLRYVVPDLRADRADRALLPPASVQIKWDGTATGNDKQVVSLIHVDIVHGSAHLKRLSPKLQAFGDLGATVPTKPLKLPFSPPASARLGAPRAPGQSAYADHAVPPEAAAPPRIFGFRDRRHGSEDAGRHRRGQHPCSLVSGR